MDNSGYVILGGGMAGFGAANTLNEMGIRPRLYDQRARPGGLTSSFDFGDGFTFDEVQNEDDAVMEKNGVKLLIDPMSYQYLLGAEIDYSEGLEGAQFVIKNPNAQSTCGCGSSFSV